MNVKRKHTSQSGGSGNSGTRSQVSVCACVMCTYDEFEYVCVYPMPYERFGLASLVVAAAANDDDVCIYSRC